MSASDIVILTSSIGLAIATYLFVRHYRIKDGVARIYFLMYTGTFVLFFTIRLIGQMLRRCDVVDPKQASEITVANSSLLLIPLVTMLLIDLYYKFK